MNEKEKSAMHKSFMIRSWDDEKLISELRNPVRATLGEEGYTLIMAEAAARMLERIPKLL